MNASRRCLFVILVLVLAVAGQRHVAAQNQPGPRQDPARFSVATANYNFLIASGFLCDSGVCRAIAQAADGESVEISGAGTLDLAADAVTAAGAFTEKSPNGDVVTTGVWTATALVSFQSYGLAPGALLRDYPELRAAGALNKAGPKVLGPLMTGPTANWMTGPIAAGGLAVIRIRLLSDVGDPREALLRVNCAKGKVPEDEQSDGIRMAITGGPSYDRQVSGRTVFLLRRSLPKFVSKSSAVVGAEH
jgi:hypothetical protein